MAITPTHLTVGQLFQQNFIFRVPKYQRYYAWDEEQIEDFLKDLEVCVAKRRVAGAQHHFLGGIVTVTTPLPGSVRRNVEVIDGQQRLATLTILAHELAKAMNGLADAVDADSPDAPHDFLKTSAQSLWRQYEFLLGTNTGSGYVQRRPVSGRFHSIFRSRIARHRPAKSG